MDIYLFSVVILVGLAVFDLVVGVSNDAVNFLNSPIGSRVAPRHVIMIIASLGMLAGVTFSSGMMEVARKGIFHPKFFLMPELITIFLAVMLTDIILLDTFNTFGLPTSAVWWRICRWRLERSTTSKSTMPMVPTPASVR